MLLRVAGAGWPRAAVSGQCSCAAQSGRGRMPRAAVVSGKEARRKRRSKEARSQENKQGSKQATRQPPQLKGRKDDCLGRKKRRKEAMKREGKKQGRKEGKLSMLSGQLGAVRPVLLTVAFRSCVGGGAGVHGQLGHAVLVACKCNIY